MKKSLFSLGVVGALLLAGGCSTPSTSLPVEDQSASESQSSSQPQPTSQGEEEDGDEQENQEDVGSDSEGNVAVSGADALLAVEVALEHTPGFVVGVEAEPTLWEVTVVSQDGTGIELEIDLDTHTVSRERVTRLDSEEQSAPAVDAETAIRTALAEVAGTLVDLDLDTDRGVIVWEAKILTDAGQEFEVYIDATTGEVVSVEQDD